VSSDNYPNGYLYDYHYAYECQVEVLQDASVCVGAKFDIGGGNLQLIYDAYNPNRDERENVHVPDAVPGELRKGDLIYWYPELLFNYRSARVSKHAGWQFCFAVP